MHKAALLDTSFFLRFLNETDPLFRNADDYFRYFLANDIDMFISSICVAEYCVGGHVSELPLRNLKIIPFNLNHAIKTGEFAQAESEQGIAYYVSSDSESKKIYDLLHIRQGLSFQFINLTTPCNEFFGFLNF